MSIKRTIYTMVVLVVFFATSVVQSYSLPSFRSSEEFENYVENEAANNDNNNNGSPPSAYDDTSEMAFKRLAPATNFFVSLCLAVFPLSFCAIIILCLTCRNDRNFSMYVKILGTICITTFIVLLIQKNTINDAVDAILSSMGL